MTKWISKDYLLGRMSLRRDEVLTKHDIETAPYAEFRWIPVSERLPEKDGFVLVYTIDKIVGEAVLINRKEFYWAGSDDDAEPIAVTHWMPLPEPPKEEENNG